MLCWASPWQISCSAQRVSLCFPSRAPSSNRRISTGFTVGAALAAWWKNNSFYRRRHRR
ncbi:MAG: phage holin [Faecalibacterium prausnitzii]